MMTHHQLLQEVEIELRKCIAGLENDGIRDEADITNLVCNLSRVLDDVVSIREEPADSD